MTGENGVGVRLGNTGLVIKTPDILGPPTVVQNEGTFPVGDYGSWMSNHIVVFGISCDSFLDVYLQLNGDETNTVLDKIADFVEGIDANSKKQESFNKTPGSPCLALYDDGNWYRARVIEDFGDNVYQVYFVDYGNTSRVKSENLLACPDDLVKYVEGITNVALHGFTGDESKDEVEILKTFIEGKDLIAKIESISFEIKGKNRTLVSLFTEKGDPVKTLVEEAVKLKRSMIVKEPAAPAAKEEEVVAVAEEVRPVEVTEEAPTLASSSSVPLEEQDTLELSVCISTPIPETLPQIENIIVTPLPQPTQFAFEDAVDSCITTVTKPRTSSLPPTPFIISISPEPTSPGPNLFLESKLVELQKESYEKELKWDVERKNLTDEIDKLKDKLMTLETAANFDKLNQKAFQERSNSVKELEAKAMLLSALQPMYEACVRSLEAVKSENTEKQILCERLQQELAASKVTQSRLSEEIQRLLGLSKSASNEALNKQLYDKDMEFKNLCMSYSALKSEFDKLQHINKDQKERIDTDRNTFQHNLFAQKEAYERELALQKQRYENDMNSLELKFVTNSKKTLDDQQQQHLNMITEFTHKLQDNTKETQQLRHKLEETEKGNQQLRHKLEESEKEKHELQEQLLSLEHEFESKLAKVRSRGGSTMDVSALPPSSSSRGGSGIMLPDMDQRFTHQRLLVEITQALSNAVRLHASEAQSFKSALDDKDIEIAALRTQLSTVLKNDTSD